MNKSSLYTSAKSFDGNKNLYLMSVFDLEPSGIIVHVYDQLHSKEYMLPVSEMEMSQAGIPRKGDGLISFLDTITLQSQGSELVLESSNQIISKIKKRPTGGDLEVMMKQPMMGGDTDSIQELLITGLMELCKVKPSGNDAVRWLGEWLIENNPNKPNVIDPDDVEEES